MSIYSNLENNIDLYLGTLNLRPGPPKRLTNKHANPQTEINLEESSYVNYNANSLNLKKNIEWDTLVSVKKTTLLPPDMLILEFLGNRLLYIQSTKNIANYLFCSMLYKSFNINISNIRLIEYKDPEFTQMMDNLQSKTCDSTIKTVIQRNFLENPFILLYEYQAIVTFLDMTIIKSNKFLHSTRCERGREIMISIGKIIGIEIFTNSDCKFPFLYNHPGFPSLVGLVIDKKAIKPDYDFKKKTSIDIYFNDIPLGILNAKSETYTAKDKIQLKHLSDYRNTLEKTLKQLLYEMKTIIAYGNNIESFNFKSMSNLVNFFKNSCEYELSSENCFHISLGIIIMLDDFCNVNISNIESLIIYIKEESIYKDFGDVFRRSASSLSFDFIKYIRKTISDIKDENEDVFKWVKEVSFEVYNLNRIQIKKNKIGKIINKENSFKITSKNSFSNKENEENKIKPSDKPSSPYQEQQKIIPEDIKKSIRKDLMFKNTNKNKKPNKVGMPPIDNNGSNQQNEKYSTPITVKFDKPLMNNTHKSTIFYKNLIDVVNNYNDMKYVPKFEQKKDLVDRKSSNSEMNQNNLQNKQTSYDDFNTNRFDPFEYLNDVHNGIYEVVNIDDELGRDFIFGWKENKFHPGIDTSVKVTELKLDERPIQYKREEKNESVDEDHKKYTRQELKELIMKKELKDTLNIKEELNKEEAEVLKEMIKEVDPELLEGRDYKGKSLGKKYVADAKMDNDLKLKLEKIEENKRKEEELKVIEKEKRRNEKMNREKEETNRINFQDN